LLVACGGDKQNTADTVFPIHAIAGASQLADVNIPAATFGPIEPGDHPFMFST
jgi:hypothetical protein